MLRYSIGSTIRDLRIEEKLSQEELCFGICSVSNLSKIENETRIPNRATFEALMQRLGKNVSFYMVFMSKEEAYQAQLFQNAISNIFLNNYVKVEESYKELRKFNLQLSGNAIIQETEFIGCILDQHYYKKRDDYFKRYINILSISECVCSEEFIKEHRLTFVEISLILYIAEELNKKERVNETISLLTGLESYINEKVCSGTEYAQMIQVVYYKLSQLTYKLDNYKKSLEYAEKGIELCKKYDRLWIFPGYLCYKGLALYKQENYDLSKKYLEQSRTIFETLGRESAAKELEGIIKDFF